MSREPRSRGTSAVVAWCCLGLLAAVPAVAAQQLLRPYPTGSNAPTVPPLCATSSSNWWHQDAYDGESSPCSTASSGSRSRDSQHSRALPQQQQQQQRTRNAQQRAAICANYHRRSASRIYVPAAVQLAGNQSTSQQQPPLNMSVIVQLASPAAHELETFANQTTCGASYACFITTAPPAAVIPGSMEVSGLGLARLLVQLPSQAEAAAAGMSKFVLTVMADPCNPAAVNTTVEVEVATTAPTVQLQLLQAPTLADNSFQVAAAFSSPVASFNVSNMDLVHAALAAIRRANDSSFILVFTGMPGKLASVQLKPKSYNSTVYMPGRASDTLAVQVPKLGDVMPAYAVAAHVLLPMSTAAAGLVCLLSVLVAPGSTLPGCLPAIIRSFGHMQLLAASASMTHAGLSGSYADAAQQLNWALLQNSQWLPGTAVTQAADAYTHGVAARLAVAPPADTGTWEAAEPDGSVVDAWLAEMQRSSSALIASYDVSTVSTASQLQQLPQASRAVQPQLPGLVTVRRDAKGPAVQAWNGLFWSVGVAVGMMVLALLLHGLVWMFSGSCQQQRRPRQGFLQPPPVQMPQLLLVAVLLGLPAVVHWAGCLAGTEQTVWMMLAGMLSSCCAAIAVYTSLGIHIFATAEDAMLGADEPEAPATTLAGNAQGYARQTTGSSLAGGFSAPGGAQLDPTQRVTKRAGQPVAEGVVQIAACTAGSCAGAHSPWTPCVTPFQDAANAAAGEAGAAAAAELPAGTGSSTCQQEVEETLLQHQARLQQHRRQGAYLSMSWKSLGTGELQQQLQQLQQQQELAGTAAVPAAAVLVTLPQPLQLQHGGPIGEANEAEGVVSSSSNGGGRQYVYSSSGAGQHPGSSSVTSVNGFFEDVTDVDVEELQRQQIVEEIREAQRRAQLRRRLRKQRMKPDAVLPPRPLPPDPAQPLPPQLLAAAVNAGLMRDDIIPDGSAAAGRWASGMTELSAARPGALSTYDSFGLGLGLGLGYKVGPDGAAAARAGVLRARPAGGGDCASCAQAVGLLQGCGGCELNELTVARLQYMAQFGPLLWDIVGGVAMADVQQEQHLLQASRPGLLVANVVFAALAGVCCALLGTVGPGLAVREPQLWAVAVLHLGWLVYVIGANPFADVAGMIWEALLATGHTLLAFCGVLCMWDRAQAQQDPSRSWMSPKASITAVCALAGMVLLLCVVQCARLVVLCVSVWHAWMYGARRPRRVAPSAAGGYPG